MQKRIFLLALPILIVCQLQAQSWLTTGNSITGTEKLGTTNNKTLDIITNNATRIKINNKGNVGIGQTTIPVTDRLNVKIVVPNNVTGLYTMTKGTFSEAVGNAGSTSLSPGVGVYGKCVDNGGWGYGGYFEGDLYGGYGRGKYGFLGTSGGSDDFGIGVQGLADCVDCESYGVMGNATSDQSGYNYGVAGYAGQSFFGNVAILGVDELGGPGTAGYFDGDIEYTGSLFDVSDAKFKSNVEPLTGSLDKIKLLQPRSYILLTEEYKGLNFGNPNEFGFIAQEIEEVFPELVKQCNAPVNVYVMGEGPDDIPFVYKAVNYVGLIPVLTAAIQEQQVMIEEKDRQITSQQKQIDDLNTRLILIEKMIASRETSVIDNNNSLIGNGAKLEQNIPNPFTGQTAIDYFIPFEFSTSAITITDMEGRLILTHNIQDSGYGRFDIEENKLVSGNYIYTLTIDGVISDSKTMVLTK